MLLNKLVNKRIKRRVQFFSSCVNLFSLEASSADRCYLLRETEGIKNCPSRIEYLVGRFAFRYLLSSSDDHLVQTSGYEFCSALEVRA